MMIVSGRNGVLRPEAVQRYCERAKTPLIYGIYSKEMAGCAIFICKHIPIFRRKWSDPFFDRLIFTSCLPGNNMVYYDGI